MGSITTTASARRPLTAMQRQFLSATELPLSSWNLTATATVPARFAPRGTRADVGSPGGAPRGAALRLQQRRERRGAGDTPSTLRRSRRSPLARPRSCAPRERRRRTSGGRPHRAAARRGGCRRSTRSSTTGRTRPRPRRSQPADCRSERCCRSLPAHRWCSIDIRMRRDTSTRLLRDCRRWRRWSPDRRRPVLLERRAGCSGCTVQAMRRNQVI